MLLLIFNKDATFSTRTIIWDVALSMIKAQPILGYGATETKYITIGNYVFNCHNIFLQLMMMGGIVMMVFFIRLIYLSIDKISKISQDTIQKTVVALLVSFFVMSMTEVYAISLAVFILFLPYLVFEKQQACTDTK